MRVLASALASVLLAQPPAPPPAAATPEVVRIDVIASDARGRGVDSLRAADFELWEDGEPQPIGESRFVSVNPANDARQFAIFLDEFHVSPDHTSRVRQALAEFVDRDLGARDLVTVMRPLDSLLSIQLTSDRAALRQAIAGFEGRKGDYTPRSDFERKYLANTAPRADAQRAQVTWSALNALAVHLGMLGPGRKTIVLVSDGLPDAERRRGFEPLPTFDSVVRAANRSTVSIYVIEPRDRAEPAAGDDALVEKLAIATDGAALTGDDIEPGLSRMVGDASAYYLLTYRSHHSDDGRFHAVEVRVKRPGVRVRARKGYWAPTVDELLRAQMLAHANDPKPVVRLEKARHISPVIRPWFGLSRGEGGKTRVTFVWEGARVPGDRQVRAPARLTLIARAADGTTVFDGDVLPVSQAVGDADDARARAVFDVTPGRLRLEMAIEDVASRAIDTDVREININDLRAPLALGTPAVMRARTARDVRAIDADPDPVPVATREFSRAERLVIRFPVYTPDEARAVLSARLLSRIGHTMRDLPVAPVAAPAGGHQIEVPLAGLAVGEYAIEITATSRSGQAKDLLNFRVTN